MLSVLFCMSSATMYYAVLCTDAPPSIILRYRLRNDAGTLTEELSRLDSSLADFAY